MVVEKAKKLWYEWVPGWLPIVLALSWVAMQYQRNNDRLDTLEHQVKDMQEYLRTEHAKSYVLPPESMLESPHQRDDAGLPQAYVPQ